MARKSESLFGDPVVRKPIPPKPTYDPAEIDALCLRVYRALLGKKDADDMVQNDKDQGEKQQRRALAYRHIVRATLECLT